MILHERLSGSAIVPRPRETGPQMRVWDAAYLCSSYGRERVRSEQGRRRGRSEATVKPAVLTLRGLSFCSASIETSTD